MAAYATDEQLYQHGLPATVLGSVSSGDRAVAREAASRKLDRYLSRNGGPLTAWTEAESRDVAVLAAYDLVVTHYLNPPSATTDVLYQKYASTMAELEKVAKLQLSTPGLVDSTPDVLEQGSVGWSDEDRGWGGL